MNRLKLAILSLTIASLIVSCESSEEHEAEIYVYEFSKYVDSISASNAENFKGKWEELEKTFIEKKLQAQSSVEALGGNLNLNEIINNSNSKFKEFKKKEQPKSDDYR